MPKLLTVFGATGNQGGSVIDTVLADPILSHEFRIRAVTRNTASDKAKALAVLGVELVQADLDDVAAVSAAVDGAHTVFAVTQCN